MIQMHTDNIEQINKLNEGTSFFLSGTVYTLRDKALKRLKEESIFPDFLRNAVIYHAGPTMENERGYISCGPTTAQRMDSYLDFLFLNNVGTIIGKGNKDTLVHRKYCKVYIMALGGLGALYGSKIKTKKIMMYRDLGSESIFRFTIDQFPVIIAINRKGKSLLNNRSKDE